ncbi:MAG: hypothetical protein SFU25_00655, partial [Candidatus Caenarcaniphilales bacterium]|nr:hypothetical protein [Candidatus Caenarcaniphilales bacterium]
MKNFQVNIGSITPFSMDDYPGHTSMVISFLGCIWDYACIPESQLIDKEVKSRVLQKNSFQNNHKYNWNDAVKLLIQNNHKVDSVVFSGGEPTLQPDLIKAMKFCKELGFLVGLHSSAIAPDKFKQCLKYVDWVGLYVKAPLANETQDVD